MQVENAEKEKTDLTKFLKNIRKSEKIIEIVDRNFEKNFKMKKENFNQIKKLRKN